MSIRKIATVSAGLVVVLYPLMIYFGLQYIDPRWISLLMVVVVGLRLLSRQMPSPMSVALAIALVAALGITLLSGSEVGLLLYPVLVNLVMFTLFAASWLYPPSIVEKLARLQEPNLSAQGVAYTRRVTLVWCIFFVINGSIAAYTLFLTREIWALYNGLVSYILIGMLFLVEMLVRNFVKEKERA